MNTPLVIGGCQIPVTLDIEQNLKEIKKAIDWAADNGVNIMSTPECALSGYLWEPPDNSDPRILEISNAINEISVYSLTKKVDLVLGTAYYNESNQWCDTLYFIIDGKIALIHYKNVLFEHQYTAGTMVGTIEYKGKTIGGLLCSDLWGNPITYADASATLVRSLRDQHCDIVFLSANTPKNISSMWRDWHNSCVRMFSHLGNWTTVVTDNTYMMEGHQWEGLTGVTCGIYSPDDSCLKAREHGTDYFKMTWYERIYT
jgi:predicted amidohydrolase